MPAYIGGLKRRQCVCFEWRKRCIPSYHTLSKALVKITMRLCLSIAAASFPTDKELNWWHGDREDYSVTRRFGISTWSKENELLCVTGVISVHAGAHWQCQWCMLALLCFEWILSLWPWQALSPISWFGATIPAMLRFNFFLFLFAWVLLPDIKYYSIR